MSWYRIEYRCPKCGHEWEEEYSCACDSECGECGQGDIQALEWERIDDTDDTDDNGREKQVSR